jgi:type I restriction enzyme S subunit
VKPDLRFAEFKDEWEKKRLGDLSSQLMYGIGASAVKFDKKNVYVRITDIDEDTRRITSDYTSPDTIDEKYLLEKNDILFARTGASTGKTYIHSKFDQTLKYYFAGFLIKFSIKDNHSSKFIYQYTFTEMYKNWVKVMSVRSGQPGINSEEYSKLSLYVPKKDEQEKIGMFFSKLDQQIELEEKKLKLLEQQKKGYAQKFYSQELQFRDKFGNEYPKWETKLMGDITKTFSGGTPKSSNLSYYNGPIPFIRSGEISKKSTELKITEKALNNSSAKLVEKGDLLYALYGATSGEVAISKINGAINQAVLCIRSEESVSFLLNYLKLKKSHILNTYIQGGQGNLSASIVKSITIKLPCKEEQIKIGNFLEKIDDLIEKQILKIKQLKQRKKGLLQKMFI